MDVKEGRHRCADMAEDLARDVGLAVAEGLGHPHPALLNTPFLLTLSSAVAIPAAHGGGLPRLPGAEGLSD